MAAPQITLFTGTVPSRVGQTKQQFSDNVNDWIAYQQIQIPETNTISTFMNDTANATNTLAESTNALAATIVSTTNFKGDYSNLTGTLNVPATVFHIGLKWELLNDLADVTLSTPSLVNADWTIASQSTDRAEVLSPFTLTTPGRYLIIGSGIITIPNPNTLVNGQTWGFKSSVGETPTVQVGVGINVFKSENNPSYDGLIMGKTKIFEATVKDGFYEV